MNEDIGLVLKIYEIENIIIQLQRRGRHTLDSERTGKAQVFITLPFKLLGSHNFVFTFEAIEKIQCVRKVAVHLGYGT
jgi:hypothetical protein